MTDGLVRSRRIILSFFRTMWSLAIVWVILQRPSWEDSTYIIRHYVFFSLPFFSLWLSHLFWHHDLSPLCGSYYNDWVERISLIVRRYVLFSLPFFPSDWVICFGIMISHHFTSTEPRGFHSQLYIHCENSHCYHPPPPPPPHHHHSVDQGIFMISGFIIHWDKRISIITRHCQNLLFCLLWMII